MLNLGIIGFGVRGDTSKLDKNLDKSEKKINRFAMLGLRAFNSLNSTSTSKTTKEIDNLNSRLEKTQREAQRTMQQIQMLESEMNSAKLKIADNKGLNLEYNNPTGAGQMSKKEYNSRLDALALEDKQYSKLLDKQIKLVEKSEEQGFKISELNTKLEQANLNLDKTDKRK